MTLICSAVDVLSKARIWSSTKSLSGDPAQNFNWCPSKSPVVRVELHNVTPCTAITKEARLPSLVSMLLRPKLPCTQSLTSGGRGRVVGRDFQRRPKHKLVLLQTWPSPPTAEAVQTPTQGPYLVGGENNHRCPCLGLYPTRGVHGITGRRSSRVWMAAVHPAATIDP